jgi:hypothetical protein
MINYVPIKHKQMSFVSNGGKFKLYAVLNDLIFPTPTQPRISFERAIYPYHINSVSDLLVRFVNVFQDVIITSNKKHN